MREDTSMLRLKRFEVTERERKVALLEAMIREFDNVAVDLAQQIAAEEERTKIRDTRHVAYSTFATAAASRLSNLLASVAALKPKLDVARRELGQVTIVLRDLELAQSHTPPFYVAAQGDRAIASPRAIDVREVGENNRP